MKETRKQIKAQLMNELSRKFERDTEYLKERCDKFAQRCNELGDAYDACKKENQDIKEENESLKAELNQYKEWIERMQDFCNLPEAERAPAFKTYLDGIKTKAKRDNAFVAMENFYQNFISMLMI